MIPVQQVWEYYGFSANWVPPRSSRLSYCYHFPKILNGNFGRYTQFSDTHVKFPASGCKVTLSTPTWSTVSDLITKKPINTPFLINDWVYSHFSSRKCVLFLEKKLELAQGFDSCGRPNGPVWPGWSDSLSCKGCEQQDGLNTKKWDSKQQKLGGLPIESGDSFTELSQLKNHRRC